jgi:hypothetical protein
MRILIDISHPAHVHLFKNFIWEMEKRGHTIHVTARDKDITKNLLEIYGIEYELIGKMQENRANLYREWLGRIIRLYLSGKRWNADVYIGMANPAIAISAWLHGKISIILTDTEHAKFQNRITFPFTRVILTPSCYKEEIGKKQIRYQGYHELAYLHPNWFAPNPAVLKEIGLTTNDTFILIRFVSWHANHDVGQFGIRDKIRLVKALEPYAQIIITSEGLLPPELDKYKIRVSPEKLHDLLYYARLYVGEGATTASEAAILGTPAIYISTLSCGYLCDEEKYELLYTYSDRKLELDEAIKKAITLLKDPDLKKNSQKRRIKLLGDKIDVTKFLVWFVENYPDSFFQIKNNFPKN